MDQYVRDRPHPELADLVVDHSGCREFSAEPLRRRQAPTGGCALILGPGPALRLPRVRRRRSRGQRVVGGHLAACRHGCGGLVVTSATTVTTPVCGRVTGQAGPGVTAPDRARVTDLLWGLVALLDAAGLRLVDVTRVPPTGFSALRAGPA